MDIGIHMARVGEVSWNQSHADIECELYISREPDLV